LIARQYAAMSLVALLALLSLAVDPVVAAPTARQAPVGDRYIVMLRDGVASPARVVRALEQARGFQAERIFRVLKGFSARLSPAQLEALRASPEVAFIDVDRPLAAIGGVPVAAGESVPAGVRRVEAATTTYTRGASGARVAVIDTGIDLAHPDLNAAHGANCIGSGPANDDNGHGTHVAGTIGARNNGAGVVGVAPGTRLVAVKVLNKDGSGSTASVVCGIDWVTSTLTDSDPANDISVANLSLGGAGERVRSCATTTDAMHKAICSAVARGVNFVVAAGNNAWDFDHSTVPDVPAAYPQVLTVTAMTDSDGRAGAVGGAPGCRPTEPDDRWASFSNYAATTAGAGHTVAAPGTCINSTWPGGGYRAISGTSMASPHVAAAVALCLNEAGTAGPCAGLTPAQVIARMRDDAQAWTTANPGYGYNGDPVRPNGSRHYGYLVRVGVEPPSGVTPSPVTTVSPAAGSSGQPPSSAVSISFSEPMDQPATEQSFALSHAGGRVTGAFSWSGNTLTFRPSAPLAEGTTFLARLASSARTASGTQLGQDLEWTFSTLVSGSRVPVAVVIENGTKRSGGYRKLAADDNDYYEVNSTTRSTFTSAWYARIANVPRDALSLSVAYVGRNTRACTQVLSMWRWSTGSWVQLDSRSVGRTKTPINRSAAGTLADFVGGSGTSGEVRVRVRCTTTAGSFFARADQLTISFTRP
jgi:subtilisin